jgi:hypothetical protein
VSIGDGKSPFWEARWFNGTPPKEIAPNMYNMARCKRSVDTELQQAKWIKNLRSITSRTLLQEYILLYMALSIVQLTNQPDGIIWRWTPDGKYSVASAYECQFQGTTGVFPATSICQAMTEPKCKFFV